MFQSIIADGEAGPQVRIFARQELFLGGTVYIMSGDASLLLGLDTSKSVFALGLQSLSLASLSTKEGSYSLQGKRYRLSRVLQELGSRANNILDIKDGPVAVTEDMLVYVAALLDGATAFIRKKYYEQPHPIVLYLF